MDVEAPSKGATDLQRNPVEVIIPRELGSDPRITDCVAEGVPTDRGAERVRRNRF